MRTHNKRSTQRQIQAWSSLVLDWCRSSLYASKLPHERTRDRCDSQVTLILKPRTGLTRSSYSYISDLEHLQALRDFIDKMEDYKSRESGVLMPQTRPGQQELYPDSGLLLSSTKLAAIHQESKKDCLRLFHLLFDQFFTHEECSNSVAFGKHGKVPEGKTILEKSKVNGILTYVMSCGKWHGWKPVEKSKLKKALINKCRMRST
ncbi:hypothetical protein QQF64_036409 [Cirrhinus molitorella]|uniref:BEN domain-containing protein n=1 Tax=Cirrhinus molitorella TaxID=172907 RepID=A0ABR3NJB8_9TELE